MNQELANPAPLGLAGFGFTTVLLNLYNAGLLGDTSISMILAMGIFYGGLAQVIAGLMEFRRGNLFGATAFTSYGLFWLSLVSILIFPQIFGISVVDGYSMAAYLFMWGLFTLYMFFATLKHDKALQTVFLTLWILFFLLAASEVTGNPLVKMIAGYEGIFCGLSAIYLSCAIVINDAFKKEILPI